MVFMKGSSTHRLMWKVVDPLKYGRVGRVCLRRFTSLHLSREVQRALAEHQPVVALESTIISHGMPYPRNVEVARMVEDLIRKNGAVPATIAVINGFPKVGLDATELNILGQREKYDVRKCSSRDLAVVCAQGLNGATTVAATMVLAHMAGISVFATGGLGGVHRGAEDSMDISADLIELGRTPVTVVCGGIKSILDVEKSLEVLETQGVPVIGYQTEEFPAFFHNKSGLRCPHTADTPAAVARIMRALVSLNSPTGCVVCVPNPCPAEADVINTAITNALAEAEELGIRGWKVTPFLLAEIESATKGRSLEANVELVINNAVIASQIALEFSQMTPRSHSYLIVESNNTLDKPTTEMSSQIAQQAPPDTPDQCDVVVIGGAVADLSAKPLEKQPLILGTSNPGECSQSWGGVGRNIAEALARLNCRTSLISAVGSDPMGRSLLEYCKRVGVVTDRIKMVTGSEELGLKFDSIARTATYTAILNEEGQLHVAVADMKVLECLTKTDIDAAAGLIRGARMVVSDANLSPQQFNSVARICGAYNVPLLFEPTSVTKAIVAITAGSLELVDVITPNEKELFAMVLECVERGLLIDNLALVKDLCAKVQKNEDKQLRLDDVRMLAMAMCKTMIRAGSKSTAPPSSVTSEGVTRAITGKHVIVTLGSEGVLWVGTEVATGDTQRGDVLAVDETMGGRLTAVRFKTSKVAVVSCTGAGDTFAGALVWGLVRGLGPQRSICAGMAAAALSVQSEHAIAPNLSPSLLQDALT